MTETIKLDTLIGAIIREANKHGGEGVTVTSLVKFVYLADFYYAQENGGKTLTGLPWIFFHYGPYSMPLQRDLEGFMASGILAKQAIEDRDFETITLSQRAHLPEIENLKGLSFYVRSRLQNDIKKFRWDLPGLLNYVYFNTTPMAHALPKESLSFEGCTKPQPDDFKPIALPRPSAKKTKRLRELFGKMADRYREEAKHPALLTSVIVDNAYLEAVREIHDDFDTEQVPEEIRGKLKLQKTSD